MKRDKQGNPVPDDWSLYNFTRKSSNAKVGPIPTTMSDLQSCPEDCPLRGRGCYAENGHVRMHWMRLNRLGMTLGQLADAIRALPAGQLWRHNVAGDLADIPTLQAIARANRGRRGFTYSHRRGGRWLQAFRRAIRQGFTVNASARSLKDADKLAGAGLPTVVVLPHGQRKASRTPGGRHVVVCPAVLDKRTTCASCQLCAKADRKAIVGFPAHGARWKVVGA